MCALAGGRGAEGGRLGASSSEGDADSEGRRRWESRVAAVLAVQVEGGKQQLEEEGDQPRGSSAASPPSRRRAAKSE